MVKARISLRTLFVVATLLIVFVGYLAWTATQVKTLNAKVKSLGGAVISRHEVHVEDGVEIVREDAPLDVTREGMPKGWLTEPVAIHLAGTKATDADVERIVGNTTLEGISLDFTRITDKSAEVLSRMPRLRGVGLGFTRITDTALKHLSELPKLKDLSLEETAVTDEGLRYLHKVKTLKHLNLAGTKVTVEGIDALVEALPEIDVNWWP